MFKPENCFNESTIAREKAIKKIKKFCKFPGKITDLPDGTYQVVSHDNNGRNNGVFKFSSSGEPMHFVALDTPFKVPSDEINMAENQKRYPTSLLQAKRKTSRQKESI
ncbi:MAG: hypothetical protein NTZ49_05915 [Candidatus Parcubacteria bacterium]|nr:hypothetical protein [Candidatus Parcubacteria bacterium]